MSPGISGGLLTGSDSTSSMTGSEVRAKERGKWISEGKGSSRHSDCQIEEKDSGFLPYRLSAGPAGLRSRPLTGRLFSEFGHVMRSLFLWEFRVSFP